MHKVRLQMSNQGYQEMHANSLHDSPLTKTYVSKTISQDSVLLSSDHGLTAVILESWVATAMAHLPIACPRNVLLTMRGNFCYFFIDSRDREF